MMEDRENTILAMAVIAFLLVMACIGWAKFVDQKKDTELWNTAYSDSMDELREVTEELWDASFKVNACIYDRNLYKEALDDVPAYCSAGMYQETIDGLREELDQCAKEKGLALSARDNAEADEDAYKALLSQCKQDFRSLTDDRNYTLTYCGWDMCACNDSFEGCPIYVLEYYADQAMCRTDLNCRNCMWQMVDNGGGLDHDEILWCLEYAYSPR